MATVLTENKLVVSYNIGVDDEGKDIFKKQSLKNISSTATDGSLLDFSDLVEEVIGYEISTVKKEQSFVLTR